LSYIDYRWCQAQLGGGWRDDELDQSIRRTCAGDPPFYGVIMLAMQRADTDNLAHLRGAWPHVYDEAHARYWSPGALLATDPKPLQEKVAASLGVELAALEPIGGSDAG
jgi:hypothetical protein